MAKATRKTKRRSQEVVPAWQNYWTEFDRSFDNLRRDMERAFASFPSIAMPSIAVPSMPSMPSMPKLSTTSCDIIDEGDKLCVEVDLPGVKKNEIDLNITDNSIEISAGHKEESEEKKKNFLRKERSELSYYRTLPLPEKVVSGSAKAKLTDGVLHISLPKSVPTPKPKKRTVKVQ